MSWELTTQFVRLGGKNLGQLSHLTSSESRFFFFFFFYIKFVTKSQVHICIDLVLRFLVLLHVAIYSGVHLSVDCEVFIVEGYSFDIFMNYT